MIPVKSGKVTRRVAWKFEKFVCLHGVCRKGDFKAFRIPLLHKFSPHHVFRQFNSFSHFLCTLYPSLPLTIFDVDPNYNNQAHYTSRNIMEIMANKFTEKILQHKDWKALDMESLKELNVTFLYNKICSVLGILENNFPEFFWEKIMWKYPNLESFERRRCFIDAYVVRFLEFVERQKDWNEVSSKVLVQLCPGVGYILNLHNSSPQLILSDTYPELVPNCESTDGYWKNRMAIDKFICTFSEVETLNDLGMLTNKNIIQYPGGIAMLNLHRNSLCDLLDSMYPEMVLKSDRRSSSRGYWKNFKNINLFYDVLHQYQIKTKNEFYRLSLKQLANVHGKLLCSRNILLMFRHWIPEEEWANMRWVDKTNKRSEQRYLGLLLKRLYPKEVIFEDYLFRFEDRVYLFDFYIPERNLVVEYQGQQHYFSIANRLSIEQQRDKDNMKRVTCAQNGLKLVYVPFWWDKKPETLTQLITHEIL